MYNHFLRLNLKKWDCNIHLPQFETTKGQTFDPSLAKNMPEIWGFFGYQNDRPWLF